MAKRKKAKKRRKWQQAYVNISGENEMKWRRNASQWQWCGNIMKVMVMACVISI